MISLWTHQQKSVDDIRAAYAAGYRAPLLVSPTASGKTVLFAYIAQQAAAKGKRVLILVHRAELLTQTSRTLDQFGVSHGLIRAGMTFTDANVQVASVQTLVRRLEKLSWSPDVIIVDEAHHATSQSTWGKVLCHYPTYVLGVTATPLRLDGRGLGTHVGGFFDCMVQGPTVADLINLGKLAKPVVYAPPSAADMSGVPKRGGDWARGAMAAAIDRPKITGDAVAHYRKHCPGEPTIAFCCSIAHAEHVAEKFRAHGYQSASIDGKLDDRERRRRIEDLGANKLDVLTSCEIISEGTDIPVVSGAILLRSTLSTALFLQQVGRAMRLFPGKKRALILDHVGNTNQHGLPDDDREWSLDGMNKSDRGDEETGPKIRQCENQACYHVHKWAPVCPKCGFVYPVQSRQLEEVDGELEQVNIERVKIEAKREQAKAKSLSDLREIARARGYKPGWAEYVFKARQAKTRGRREFAA